MGRSVKMRMEYQVALMKSDGSETYDSTALLAASNLEAVEKAKRWIASVGCIAEDARLQINLNGMGIMSLRPGEF
jgi:hypothetical protein